MTVGGAGEVGVAGARWCEVGGTKRDSERCLRVAFGRFWSIEGGEDRSERGEGGMLTGWELSRSLGGEGDLDRELASRGWCWCARVGDMSAGGPRSRDMSPVFSVELGE